MWQGYQLQKLNKVFYVINIIYTIIIDTLTLDGPR